jgi:DNA processing protein
MNVSDYLSDDGQALLALCSACGLPPDADARGLDPFKLSEWNELSKRIGASPLQRPSELHGKKADDLARQLKIEVEEAERISRLLDRAGRLAIELDALYSRGIWAVTRVDELYPAKLRETLKHQAPTVLFGSGDIHLLRKPGVAVVGSRNIDEKGAAFAKEIGRKAVRSGMAVVSGGARGTDRIAMDGAMEADGVSIGALADSLEATIRKGDVRQLLIEGRLVFLTPFAPSAGFSVGAAMGRNKVIYGLSNYAVVVSSELETGGTWAGAIEALKGSWCPVFVRDGDGMPTGNQALIKRGAVALPESDLNGIDDLQGWMQSRVTTPAVQTDLFG